jgi:hypothetical protein
MYNSDTDFLYPTRVTPLLRGIRGGVWDKLVDFISGTQSSEFEKAAFSLMMVRLGGAWIAIPIPSGLPRVVLSVQN